MSDDQFIINNTIGENEFKDKYLDILFNLDTVEKQQEWTKVSGDPRLPVTVVDDSTGEQLFTVPPVDYGPSINNKNIDISHIAEQAELISNGQTPVAGINFFTKHTEGLIGDPVIPKSDLKKWREIAERYNLMPDKPATDNKVTITDDNDF